ncbi:MAG: ATP-binding cassette domain-containing protein [Clostridia bacterium]|nr:ATP-binding cassette domain-containing protein [Clostridia bacterium]
MIEVKDLTKYYVKNKALDHVSFSLKEGEILGFLGPNGAGKSTTMNIITGYLSSDSGSVKIDGIDILEEPKEAKKRIGYLPEQPPLYNDMTVQKYLEFMFKLKKVRLPMKEHINSICEQVKISDVKEKIIKHLSKGYRQRVGLAQALLGDPPVRIRDKPTVGLDPIQIVEIRRLIRDLGKQHTVILSSHLLSEVQAVCDKILIINHGKIVADELTSSITQTGSSTVSLELIIEGRRQTVHSILQKVDGVIKVTDKGECERGCYEFRVDSRRDVRRLLFRAFAKTDFSILSMRPVEQSLEDIYLDIITGKSDTEEAS